MREVVGGRAADDDGWKDKSKGGARKIPGALPHPEYRAGIDPGPPVPREAPRQLTE